MRAAALCALGGSAALIVGTLLHPMHADPGRAAEAFAEYAADRLWIASHLLQLLGVALIVAALLALSLRLEQAGKGAWARLAAGGAIASLALAAALQAVDGIALKAMVDTWARASAAQKEAAFLAALGVRQIEVGLAAVASLLFGATSILYGAALRAAGSSPLWLQGLALAAGVAGAAAGLVVAYSGFSGAAMALSMPAGVLQLAWIAGLGLWMWRTCR